MNEYWIEVKGHPRYMVSTMGRVKCLDWNKIGKEKICDLYVNVRSGYCQVFIDGKLKYVHRIVLESFIPNPEKKPCVDHINTVRKDNRVENLRWVTHKENCNNPLSKKRYRKNAAISIIQLTKDGQFIKKWHSAREVERELGIPFQNISHCCRGKIKSAGGFKWVYASNYKKTKKISEIKPLF